MPRRISTSRLSWRATWRGPASALFSSHKLVNVFGAAALLSFGLAYAIYQQWFISVWCFFAAVLSVIVLLHFTNRASSKESSHGLVV